MKFYIIGIDDSAHPRFSPEQLNIIERGEVFSGGLRHRQIVGDQLPDGAKWVDITPPMSTLFESYANHAEVVVFASGDPLFYGFAQTVQRLMPEAEVVTFPHFNSLHQLAHRLVMPYQNMHVVSLTGRPWRAFDAALIESHEMIGVLTDTKDHTPRKIAQRMVKYGYTNYTISVGVHLGNELTESVETLSVEEVASRDFDAPNNMILKRRYNSRNRLGIPDSEFMLLDGRTKMITKMPIRLATLAKLDLHRATEFWDVGFCTGSISIEAKLRFPHLDIHSFEVREECARIMEGNQRRFGAVGIEFQIDDFCEADIEKIPNPDAVFIGGHGGKLVEMVSKIAPRLNGGGVLVFNSVSKQSYDSFMEAVAKNNLTIAEESTIALDQHNPITIIKATKY
ncbi:MAG: precorrin-6y C5,15-methyltransferase (decarboxylating) subunit CbiE [Rikenellaceae bacterium]